MAARLTDSKGLLVPGPGAYNSNMANLESVKASKFGSGGRGPVELPTARVVPGVGEHSPFKFGFGSSKRNPLAAGKSAQFPGPGNYDLGTIVGKDGTSKTMHGVITFDPDHKENSYKPGPGNYDPDVLKTRKKEPQYKLGSSTRLDLEFQTK